VNIRGRDTPGKAKEGLTMEKRSEKVQFIMNSKGAPAFAVVPWHEYERLRAAGGEDAALVKAGNAARGEEAFPAVIAKRLAKGEPPVRVFREWRGLTQQQLSTSSGVANQYISQLERGVRNAGRVVARKLAPALGVSMDALLD
jgi:DNA-binding XRE family transcriptional regulator